MLVDHTNSTRDGICRVGNLDGLPIEKDLTFIRASQSKEDVHERRLACSIFAKQGMDFSGFDIQINFVVSNDTRITLCDSAHLEPRRRRRWLCNTHRESFVT